METSMMKSITREKYGGAEVVQYTESPKPTPKPNECLIKIKAASVNSGDIRMLKADPPLVKLMIGLFNPKKTLGVDFAGVIEEVGSKVTDFKVGDEVFGEDAMSLCSYAEYACYKPSSFALKPKNLNFKEAAAAGVAASTAFSCIKQANVQPGQKILIGGASGGVGSWLTIMSKAIGAKVTAIASESKSNVLKQIGADATIDYKKEDPTKVGEYDVIFHTALYQPASSFANVLKSGGVFINVGGSLRKMVGTAFTGMVSFDKKYQTCSNNLDYKGLAAFIEEKDLKPYIDKEFPLSQAADAIQYVDSRKVTGKVVIVME